MDNQTIGSRLRRAMGEIGENELARLSGVPQSTIHRILVGDSREPRYSNLEKLAKALGVPAIWLSTGGQDPSATTLPLGASTENANNPSGGIGDKEPMEGAITIGTKRIPVVGNAQFGDEGYWEELQYPVGHGDGHVEYPSGDMNAYALRGYGTSMEPRFRHGEYVIIEPNTEVFQGDEVMVRLVNGKCMAKIYAYQRDGMVYLDSVNKDHSQIAVPLNGIEKMHFIAGVAKRSLYRPANG